MTRAAGTSPVCLDMVGPQFGLLFQMIGLMLAGGLLVLFQDPFPNIPFPTSISQHDVEVASSC